MSVENDLKVLSVEQLNLKIKGLLETQIDSFWVKGELSNFKKHTSGHFYFSLKDSKSQISAVMFRGHNMRLKFIPHDGLEVLLRGRISVYEPRGNYQIIADMMEPVGAGALQKAFEQLKQKLKAEGLFEASRKRPLPLFPKRIAVVTSPTGAAIRDIINVLKRRAPGIEVVVVPTVVQGEGASGQIIRAFEQAQKLKDIDVIICGRGGGSIEDLWAFNDEGLARKISQSVIPVISAVGHEIDFTIADFVADLRAPTPSAAAELVAKSSSELNHKVQSLHKMMINLWQRQLSDFKRRLFVLEKGLVDPQKRLQDFQMRCDDLISRMQISIDHYLVKRSMTVANYKSRLVHPEMILSEKRKDLFYLKEKLMIFISENLKRKTQALGRETAILDSLSPLKVVERGYSIVQFGNQLVKSANDVEVGDEIKIQLSAGKLIAEVKHKEI